MSAIRMNTKAIKYGSDNIIRAYHGSTKVWPYGRKPRLVTEINQTVDSADPIPLADGTGPSFTNLMRRIIISRSPAQLAGTTELENGTLGLFSQAGEWAVKGQAPALIIFKIAYNGHWWMIGGIVTLSNGEFRPDQSFRGVVNNSNAPTYGHNSQSFAYNKDTDRLIGDSNYGHEHAYETPLTQSSMFLPGNLTVDDIKLGHFT